MREYRFLAVAFAVLYVIVVATAGRPYYLVGLYAPLAAAGALGFARRREHGPTRPMAGVAGRCGKYGAGVRRTGPFGDHHPI